MLNCYEFCNQAIGDLGDRQTQNLRTDDVERSTQDGCDKHNHQGNFLRAEVAKQAQGRLFEVLGFLHRPAQCTPATSAHGATILLHGSSSLLSFSILFAHAISSAISAVESCEETMSL